MCELKTKILKTELDWELVKNCCRSTVKKAFTSGEPSNDFKRTLLIAEHSPVRELKIVWKWEGIPYWVSTEWSRHKFEKYITSQRNDRQKDYDRNAARQDAPVDFIGSANLQQLIDSFRKRLCYTATKEARVLALDFKRELSKQYPIEASNLVPHCVYRGGCSEMLKCGHYRRFLSWWENNSKEMIDTTDIGARYYAYSDYVNQDGK